MEKMYFNKHEFLKALDLCNKDPKLAVVRFAEYTDKYPDDVGGLAHYITSLITIKHLEEAEAKLKILEEKIKDNVTLQKHLANHPQEKADIVFCKVKLFAYKKEYDKCYDVIMDNFHTLKYAGRNLEATATYCQKQAGFLRKDFLVNGTEYLYRQIVDYSDEKFLEHIKKHLTLEGIDVDDTVTARFAPDFPVDKVFSEIKRITPSNLCLYNGMFENTYLYKFDDCGKNKNRMTNYFKVIAFNGTNQFITMCPCIEGEFFDYYDLNYLKEEKKKSKPSSGIDRFNKRYGKKLDN